MRPYCFGIDIGGTTIKFGCFKTDGTLLEKWETLTKTFDNGVNIIPDVAAEVLNKMQERDIDKNEVEGVGICVPGPVNDNGEISGAVNLHWGYKHLVNELEELLGVPVKAGNDANVAALGEMWMGAAKGCKNLIMVTLGTGVGGGIIVNGRIIAGAHGAAGEIGHANVEHCEKEQCNCGNRGCLEQVASATGIVRLARKELDKSKEASLLREGEISAKNVLDAFKAGDALATKVVDLFASYLGNALAIFAAVVDPERIVIGGGVSKAGVILTDLIGKHYRRDAFPACKNTAIVLASLGNDAGIYGSAKLVLDKEK